MLMSHWVPFERDLHMTPEKERKQYSVHVTFYAVKIVLEAPL